MPKYTKESVVCSSNLCHSCVSIPCRAFLAQRKLIARTNSGFVCCAIHFKIDQSH